MLDAIFNHPSLQRIKYRAYRRLQCQSDAISAGSSNPPTEQDVYDVLARTIYDSEKNLKKDICARAFAPLMQVSPGGILAMSWLCRNAADTLTTDKVKKFALEIANPDIILNLTKAASQEPLSEKESVFCADSILGRGDLSHNDCLDIMICLLISNCLSEDGRNAVLERTLDMRCFTLAEKRILYQWALGLNVEQDIGKGFLNSMPASPSFLARKAIVSLVCIGEDAAKIVNHILKNIDCWIDTKPILDGLLDLIEMRERDSREREMRMPADPNIMFRKSVFEHCVRHENSTVRRRAYAIALKTEDKEFLQQALKDRDLGVRSWAIANLKQLR